MVQDKEYYHRLAAFALDAGELMIRSGAETHRVEDTMSRLIACAGEDSSAVVLPTIIMMTLSVPGVRPITLNRRILSGNNNLGRVCAVNDISRRFCHNEIDLEHAEKELDAVKNGDIYQKWIRVLGTAIGTAAFSVVFGGSWFEFLVALLCGFVLGLETCFLTAYIGRDFFANMLGAVTVSFLAIAAGFFLKQWVPSLSHILVSSVIAGAIMPLVPGVAITNAIRDILAGDYLSALSRAIEAFLVAATIAIGVMGGVGLGTVLHWTDGVVFGSSMVNFWQCIAAACASIGFCFVFRIPKKLILPCGVCGALCWAVYALMTTICSLKMFWSIFVATIAVDLLSHLFAHLLRAPVTVFLISGILLLVPGFSIYSTAYYLLQNASMQFTEQLKLTMVIAGAIALAVFTADAVLEIGNRIKKVQKMRKTK